MWYLVVSIPDPCCLSYLGKNNCVSNSYGMACPPVCRDNLTHRWKNMVYLFYTSYISVDLTHHEIFRAKVGKGGLCFLNIWH